MLKTVLDGLAGIEKNDGEMPKKLYGNADIGISGLAQLWHTAPHFVLRGSAKYLHIF